MGSSLSKMLPYLTEYGVLFLILKQLFVYAEAVTLAAYAPNCCSSFGYRLKDSSVKGKKLKALSEVWYN